jgi:hypothetical protein
MEEMQAAFGRRRGVSKLYREGDGVVVEHDGSVITAEQLLDIFRGLPSFYSHRFVPSVMENSGGQD